MDESKSLSASGVTNNNALDFVIEATEGTIEKQMTELLKTRDLTCDELGLLYCYKYGVSVNQALKTLGNDMKVVDFIKSQKSMILENGKVSLVRDDTTLKPFSMVQQLEQILREHGPTMEVTALCSKFVQKFHVSVANIAQQRPADFLAKEKDTFALLPGGMVTLKEFEVREKAKVTREIRDARSRSPQQRRAASPAQPKDWSKVRATD